MRKLIKYGNRRFKLLNINLGKYKQHTKLEQLHQIRVELKKIKSLFNLLEFNSKSFNSSVSYKSLKNIFTEAGRIRESDVLHQILIEYKLIKFEKLIIPTIKERGRAIIKFQVKTQQYKKVVKRVGKNAEIHLEKINRKGLEKYILKAERKVNKKLFPKFRQDMLHKIRKQIKEVIYLSQIIYENSTPPRIKNYDALQNTIGEWHDKNMLIELLQKSKISSYKSDIKTLKIGCATDNKEITRLIRTIA